MTLAEMDMTGRPAEQQLISVDKDVSIAEQQLAILSGSSERPKMNLAGLDIDTGLIK